MNRDKHVRYFEKLEVSKMWDGNQSIMTKKRDVIETFSSLTKHSYGMSRNKMDEKIRRLWIVSDLDTS